MLLFDKKIQTLTVLFIALAYFAYINFNLPFLCVDELNGTVKSFHYQFQENLQTGRISHFFAMPTSYILNFKAPLPFDIVPRYFSMIILFFTLILYLSHLGLNYYKATLIASFTLIVHQLDWEHNGFIAFYGSYSIYLSAFLLAVILFEKQYNQDRLGFFNSMIVFLLILLSFASEFFVGLSFIYLLLRLMFQSNFIATIKSPFSYALLLYILTYIMTRQYTYDGPSTRMNDYIIGSLTEFGIIEIVQGFMLYTVYSFPLYEKLELSKYFSFSLLFVLIISIGLMIFKFIRQEHTDKNQKTVHIVLLLFLIFIPQFLISLQPMKLHWIMNGMSHRYVFSMYTWIGFVMMAVLLINVKKTLVLKILSVALMSYSVVSAQNNIHFIHEYKQSLVNWRMINTIFQNSTDNQTVKIPISLLSDHPYIAPVSEEYIKLYGKDLHGKHVLVCSNYNHLNLSASLPKTVKLINFYDAEHAGRWTNGKKSSIVFPMPLKAQTVIRINIANAIGENVSKPILITLGNMKYSKSLSDTKEIFLELHEDIENPVLEITIPQPISPSELGIGSDTRQLGIMVKEISIGKMKDNKFQMQIQEICN